MQVDEEIWMPHPDWKCEYCGSMNWSTEKTCSNCGAQKTVSERVEAASYHDEGDWSPDGGVSQE